MRWLSWLTRTSPPQEEWQREVVETLKQQTLVLEYLYETTERLLGLLETWQKDRDRSDMRRRIYENIPE